MRFLAGGNGSAGRENAKLCAEMRSRSISTAFLQHNLALLLILLGKFFENLKVYAEAITMRLSEMEILVIGIYENALFFFLG